MNSFDAQGVWDYGPRLDEEPDNPIDESSLLRAEHLPLHDLSDDSSPATPRPSQDRMIKPSKWVPSWVPLPFRVVGVWTSKWIKGPDPPRIHKIHTSFPSIQESGVRILDRFIPKFKHRILLLLTFYGCWILTFALVYHQGTLATEIEGWGVPADVSCGYAFFRPGNSCGLGGNECRPFSGNSFGFRCPGECASRKVLNPRAIGAQEVNYVPLIIGGPSDDEEFAIYRGDSFLCGSAIHAGIIDDTGGGCGVVSQIGPHRNYENSTRNGMTSFAFEPEFPSSFTFHTGAKCAAKDPRWELLVVSVLFTVVLSMFTTSAKVFFFSVFTGIFVHVGFASDPPPHSSTIELISDQVGKFLPAMFCAVVIYRYMGVRRTLTGLTAQIEKSVLWLGGCWVGALTNVTFDFIPIQRLNPYDIQQQPGAKAALTAIILLLIVIIASQIVYFQREGRLIKYLKLYGLFVTAIAITFAFPGLNLRIHHYILALLLLPGTSMQTRPSLLYQGILIGFFINGISRWNFDPVLQTAAALRGDAPSFSLLPVVEAPVIEVGTNISSIAFSWTSFPEPFDGLSVMINDVERYRTYSDEIIAKDMTFNWTKDADLVGPEYFRFGYMQGARTWDYTKAGTWNSDGTWTEMEDGPSRHRSIK